MPRCFSATWKQVATTISSNERKPGGQRILRLLGDFKLHGPLGFLLDYGGAVPDRTTRPQVLHAKSDEITGTELAVDGKIEERQFSVRAAHFKANSDRPHILRLKRSLLTNQNSLIPRTSGTQHNVHDKAPAAPPTSSPVLGSSMISRACPCSAIICHTGEIGAETLTGMNVRRCPQTR